MTPQAFQYFKMSTLENNTLFEMSISRKTNRFLEFCQSAYLVLIKQHTCKVSTLRLHKQKTIELFQFFTSNSTFPLTGNKNIYRPLERLESIAIKLINFDFGDIIYKQLVLSRNPVPSTNLI